MDCSAKLEKLLDTHLEGTITREEYTAKKQKILNQKIEINEFDAGLAPTSGAARRGWGQPSRPVLVGPFSVLNGKVGQKIYK